MDRIELINFLIKNKGYKSYLEIGCDYDECFKAISIDSKIGVDPVRGGTNRIDSDGFFKTNSSKFDIIFIDGYHYKDQVIKDVDNSLDVLIDDGIIVLHDCNPKTKEEQDIPQSQGVWTGDVWKAIAHFRTQKDLDIAVGDFDYGCGMIRKGKNKSPLNLCNISLDWDYFQENSKEILNLLDCENVKTWINDYGG